MQVYNVDETGVCVVHKPGKVFSAVGRKHVYSVTSGERGRTHTVVVCVSASGQTIPPLMIYPRKRAVPESMRNGAVPGTLFKSSDNGWITQDIYLEWFKFFIESIPQARPVLLIEDRHASHISLNMIELARANNIHLLCLPSHTSHILQPLDIGVFKSFKSGYSKACRRYMMENPGRVITSESIAGLVGEAWVHSITPVNILSGFRKSGIFPLNPSEVSDRMLAPSIVSNPPPTGTLTSSMPSFSDDQIALYEKRYQEGYDLPDPQYELWLKENHPGSDTDSLKTHVSGSSSDGKAKTHCTSSTDLSDILKYPEGKYTSKAKPGMNSSCAVCLSDSPVVKELKEKQEQKQRLQEEKLRKKEESLKKREEQKEKRKGKTRKLREKEQENVEKQISSIQLDSTTKEGDAASSRALSKEGGMASGGASSKEGGVALGKGCDGVVEEMSEEDDGDCPVCHVQRLSCRWICCDNCDMWYHMHCTDVNPNRVPDIFYCSRCV